MSTKPSRGSLPVAPQDYSADYMNKLLRQLDISFQQLRSPGQLLGAGDPGALLGKSPLNLVNIPTSATGLKPGDVWSDAGVLKIVS